MLRSRVRSSLLAVAFAASSLGCGGGSPPTARDPSAAGAAVPLRPLSVSEADFAERTYQLLLDPEPSGERQNLLAGVVRRQLARAEARFSHGSEAAGLRALLGAFLLVRNGEFHPELVRGTEKTLWSGAREVSRLGHEGYALALYSLLLRQLEEGAARAEVQEHLDAIEEFSRATRGGGPLEAASSEARVALQRALLEPTDAALTDARERLIAWVRGALEANSSEQAMRTEFDQDETYEAYRALRGGTIALVALYLRHGDAAGALSALQQSELERLFPPELAEQLERAAEDRDADAWVQLFRLFESAAESGSSLAVIDPQPMAAAAFGSALELYRTQPGALEAAMPLAAQLVKYGMAEVASVVLTQTITEKSPAAHVGVALAMVLNSMVAEDAEGQLDGARRTFVGAERLLALAEGPSFRGKVSPSAARVRYVMAALEARHGDLTRALPLVKQVLAVEPSADALMLLTSIQRQQGQFDAARATLDKVIGIAKKNQDLALETDAMIQKFEILRDAGQSEQAGIALEAALVKAVEAQRQGRPGPSQARVERLLARVLEQYDNQPGVRRATQRAYAAANGDVRQLAATVLDVSRRAFTQGDLQAARAAAQRAIEASLGPDEIVYVALWLQLLERRLKVPSDGTVEEAYATIEEASGWPAKLRAWARGKLSDVDLHAVARDEAERTEARFYTALAKLPPGAPEARVALREIATSGAVDLMEVTIARDLLAPPTTYVLPERIAIP
ncbi:MAG TPA: tetratricopeptide repeat protein [Polyangiaceae bacterium]|nr:tetratricopeptide repeat protein [Polyangiaceae bacterium]